MQTRFGEDVLLSRISSAFLLFSPFTYRLSINMKSESERDIFYGFSFGEENGTWNARSAMNLK